MPCRSSENGIEAPTLLANINEDDNSGEDVWSEDETLENEYYVQLADQNDDTGVYSSDDDESDMEHNYHSSHPFNQTDDVVTDIDCRIELALAVPDLDVNVGPGFPDLPPSGINIEPSPASQMERHSKLTLSESDENFIRNSMSVLTIAPPPWAATVNEGNWKNELKKHLAKD